MAKYRAKMSPEEKEKLRQYFIDYAAKLKADPVRRDKRKKYNAAFARKNRANPDKRDLINERQRIEAVRRRRERRSWFRAYKRDLSCVKCGSTRRLHFHHRVVMPNNRSVSNFVVQGNSIKRILEEIAKCDVLCHKCHHAVHTGARRAAKSLI
jgi:hypothetical protein